MVPWFNQLQLVAARRGPSSSASDSDGRAEPAGQMLWRFPVLKEYLQGLATMHGGAHASAHDTCTAWTLLTVRKPDFWPQLGTSRVLNMAYYRAAKEGEILLLETKVRLSRSATTQTAP